MKCELCNKSIRNGETVHGIKYGTEDNQHNVFLPAKDSAWTIFCSACGETLCRLIYAKLGRTTFKPSIHKTINPRITLPAA